MKKSIKKFFSGSLKHIVLTGILAISANVVMASDIANSDNYKPGGKYRLFGGGRGDVANLTNYIRVGGGLTQQVGNLAISTTTYSGGLSYEMQFHNHGWRVHSPFANEARQDFHSKNGTIVNGGGATLGGATLTDLSVTGYEIHPADGYDGEQGGGYPTPTGARDEYLYLVNGKEVSVKIVNPDKVPPKATDDKILRNVGIDPTPYNQTNLNDRPTFEKLTLVGANDSGGLTGYNGGAENGSADTSTNGNGWNNAETGSPLSLYNGQHDSNPYGVQPYHLSPASLTTDGNAATPDTRTEFQKARDNWINCQGSACGQAGNDFITKNPAWDYTLVGQTGQNLAEGDVSGLATDLALSRLKPVKGVGSVADTANDIRKTTQRAENTGAGLAKGFGQNQRGAVNIGNKSGTGLKYEPAPYHSKTGNNIKSPAPTNGQDVLNNSVPIGNNTSRRVGVDKTTGEYVVFDKHADGTYHGHTRPWSGNKGTALTTDMQNALIKAGLTNRKGKIL